MLIFPTSFHKSWMVFLASRMVNPSQIFSLLCLDPSEQLLQQLLSYEIYSLINKGESEVTQSCPTFSDPVDCSLPSSSVHGILQARILEWVAISFSRGSSWPRDRTWVSHIGGRCFNLWATSEAHKWGIASGTAGTQDQKLQTQVTIICDSQPWRHNRTILMYRWEKGVKKSSDMWVLPQTVKSDSVFKISRDPDLQPDLKTTVR